MGFGVQGVGFTAVLGFRTIRVPQRYATVMRKKHIYLYMYVCIFVYVHSHIYIYMYVYARIAHVIWMKIK